MNAEGVMMEAASAWLADGDHIGRDQLSGRIDDFLIDRLDPAQDRFPLRVFVPELRWNRFDLAIKLAYAQSLGPEQPAFIRRLYDAHIHAFSLGDMREPGSDSKTRIEAFHQQFAEVLTSVRERGFDPDQSLVPLAEDGSLLNGGHRAAAARLLRLPLIGVETGLPPFRFDYRYFRNRGMTDEMLDAAALKQVELAPDARIALIWPSAPDRDADILRILGPLSYCKKVFLNPNGALNFLSQVYEGEAWTGRAADGLPGIRAKQAGCFASARPVRMMVHHADGRDPVAVKEQIRALFDLGKHSIHMTDTHDEAVMIARLLLNANSVRFLNGASPFGTGGGMTLTARFRDYLRRHGADAEEVLIDCGFVMAAHGLRPARRIDFLSRRALPSEAGITRHPQRHYPLPLAEMLADPAHHFHFWGLKFVAPDLLSQMKAARNAGQDAEDLRLLAPILERRRLAQWRRSFVYAWRIRVARLRRGLIRLLAWLGLRDRARRLYLAMRRPPGA